MEITRPCVGWGVVGFLAVGCNISRGVWVEYSGCREAGKAGGGWCGFLVSGVDGDGGGSSRGRGGWNSDSYALGWPPGGFGRSGRDKLSSPAMKCSF